MTKRLDEQVEDALHERLAEIGRKGGKSRSEEKVRAARENMRKALEARWKKRFRGTAGKGRRRG